MAFALVKNARDIIKTGIKGEFFSTKVILHGFLPFQRLLDGIEPEVKTAFLDRGYIWFRIEFILPVAHWKERFRTKGSIIFSSLFISIEQIILPTELFGEI